MNTEFDQVYEQLEAPEYPATCDECGEVGTNASMEGHECAEGYDIEQGRVAFQKELTGAMVRAGAREVELSGPRAGSSDPDQGQRCICGSWNYQHEEGTGACIMVDCECKQFTAPRAAEGERWQVLEYVGFTEILIPDRGVMTVELSGNTAEQNSILAAQIITEHNTHATLVEQRDLLMEAARRALRVLREVAKETKHSGHGLRFPLTEQLLNNVITTIEQSVRNAGEGGR